MNVGFVLIKKIIHKVVKLPVQLRGNNDLYVKQLIIRSNAVLVILFICFGKHPNIGNVPTTHSSFSEKNILLWSFTLLPMTHNLNAANINSRVENNNDIAKKTCLIQKKVILKYIS